MIVELALLHDALQRRAAAMNAEYRRLYDLERLGRATHTERLHKAGLSYDAFFAGMDARTIAARMREFCRK